MKFVSSSGNGGMGVFFNILAKNSPFPERLGDHNNNNNNNNNIIIIIVSITKCSIVIGSPRAYLTRKWRMITWVSNYSCPI